MAGNAQDNPQQQQQNLNLRQALSDAYAAVESDKLTQSFSAVTFEDLANQQIQAISGPDTPTRPNELNQVKNILTNLTQAVQQIQAMPANAFEEPDSTRDVNSPA
jgi:hypothetical protein